MLHVVVLAVGIVEAELADQLEGERPLAVLCPAAENS